MTDRRDIVVVGAGHNGLVAACYLARAGFEVEVLERDSVVGGAVSTVERWPGVFVDRGSTLHVMVRHTGIVEELELADAGLDYIDVDPWATAVGEDASIRFATDLDATYASIADACGRRDAEAYADFAAEWSPRVDAMLAAFHQPPTMPKLARAFWPLGRKVGAGGGELARSFLQSADSLLDAAFTDSRLRAALAWWAAQAGPAPHETGTAPMLATALLMHRRAPGRPRGGSGGLTQALAGRLERLGGRLSLGDSATRITATTVETAGGRRIESRAVVSATHIVTTLELVGDEALRRSAASRLKVGHGMGVVLRVLTDRLPPYRTVDEDVHVGMQLLVQSPGQLRTAYADYLQGQPPQDPPLLVMTPTATDRTLAPEGRHVVTVWSQWHPHRLREGPWDGVRQRETDRLVTALDKQAPGFASSVLATHLQTPADLESELDLRAGNVMHLDMTLDAMFTLRPLPEWSGYRGPNGVFLCGASTHPGGGVSGASGRNAAAVVIRHLRRRRRKA